MVVFDVQKSWSFGQRGFTRLCQGFCPIIMLLWKRFNRKRTDLRRCMGNLSRSEWDGGLKRAGFWENTDLVAVCAFIASAWTSFSSNVPPWLLTASKLMSYSTARVVCFVASQLLRGRRKSAISLGLFSVRVQQYYIHSWASQDGLCFVCCTYTIICWWDFGRFYRLIDSFNLCKKALPSIRIVLGGVKHSCWMVSTTFSSVKCIDDTR